MNPFEFVLAVIIVGSVFRIIRFRMGDRGAFQKPWMSRREGEQQGFIGDGSSDGDTSRLREEVKQLKDRINVLERIAVDKENSLARQIDDLRDTRP